jgi:hypothetical protein
MSIVRCIRSRRPWGWVARVVLVTLTLLIATAVHSPAPGRADPKGLS